MLKRNLLWMLAISAAFTMSCCVNDSQQKKDMENEPVDTIVVDKDSLDINEKEAVEDAGGVKDESHKSDTTLRFIKTADLSTLPESIADKYPASETVRLELSLPYDMYEEMKMSIKEDGDSLHIDVYPPQTISHPTHYIELLLNEYNVVVGKGEERNYGVVNQRKYIVTRNALIDALTNDIELRNEIRQRIDIERIYVRSWSDNKAVIVVRLSNPNGTCELYEYQLTIDLNNQKIHLHEIEREYVMGS